MNTESARPLQNAGPATKPTLLIADDSRVIRFSLKKILRDEFEIIEAVDGEEAWLKLQETPDIKAVFSDLSMPNLDGYGLLERVRASAEERIRSLPFIVVTAKEGELDDLLAEVQARGGNDLVSKPFRSAEIVERTRQFLAETKAESAEAQRQAEEAARVRAEQDRIAAEKAEQARLVAERLEHERLAAEKVELERLVTGQAAAEPEAPDFEWLQAEGLSAESLEHEGLSVDQPGQEGPDVSWAGQHDLSVDWPEQEESAPAWADQEIPLAERPDSVGEADNFPTVNDEVDLGAPVEAPFDLEVAVPAPLEPQEPASEEPPAGGVAADADVSLHTEEVEVETAEASVQLTEDELIHIRALQEKARREAEEKACKQAVRDMSSLSRALLWVSLPFMQLGNKLLRLKRDEKIEQLRRGLRG